MDLRMLQNLRPLLYGPAIALTGLILVACQATVQLQAPKDPIVVNMNVKIEQQVRVKLENAGLALAQGLDEARLLGYLGERPDGYLGQHDPNAPAWALELMTSINSQRELKYKELALKNGTSLEAEQIVAGEKIIESLPAGTYYMDATGTWMQN